MPRQMLLQKTTDNFSGQAFGPAFSIGEIMNKAGLYIHIPFCKSKCPYCDFYSLRKGEEDYKKYVSAVIKSLKKWSSLTDKKADTLYFGGGTPSLIGSELLCGIIENAKKTFGCDGEITVECNPSTVNGDFFNKIAESGVNRISLGMQSAVDSERKKLGRFADKKQIESVIKASLDSGISNISLDVMTGIPDQTKDSLDETLKFCTESGATHISAYMLKLEEGTWFYKNSHKLNLPDEDLTADLYLQMVDYLEEKGFRQYEISNFALPGYESRHNLKYWNCEEYIGIGPGAHSFLQNKRFYYPRDIDYFEKGSDPVFDDEGGSLEEYIMLRLRLSEGLDFKKAKERFPDFEKEYYISKARSLQKNNLVRVSDESISLTKEGFLLSNAVTGKIIY